MDGPVQRMVIVSLLRFVTPVSIDRLRSIMVRVAQRHPAFGSRVRDRGIRGPEWERVPELEVAEQIRTVHAYDDDASLRELVSELASVPLDPARPLWDMTLTADGRALVSRIHHCIADGVALVQVLAEIADDAAGEAEVVGWTPPKPSSLGARLAHLGEASRTLMKTLFLSRDPPSLRGPLQGRKSAAWTRDFPVARARDIGHLVSGTVNDALLAAVAGALDRYARELGRPLRRDARALVPVFLRGAHATGDLGNAFGLVYAALPRDDDRRARLAEAKRRMDAIKASSETSNAVMVLGVLGRALPSIERFGLRLFTSKASLVFTNVPGPPGDVRVADSVIRSMTVWAPVSGDLALGVTAVSYRGSLRIGVMTDEAVLPSPERIAELIEAELHALGRLADAGAPRTADARP